MTPLCAMQPHRQCAKEHARCAACALAGGHDQFHGGEDAGVIRGRAAKRDRQVNAPDEQRIDPLHSCNSVDLVERFGILDLGGHRCVRGARGEVIGD